MEPLMHGVFRVILWDDNVLLMTPPYLAWGRSINIVNIVLLLVYLMAFPNFMKIEICHRK